MLHCDVQWTIKHLKFEIYTYCKSVSVSNFCGWLICTDHFQKLIIDNVIEEKPDYQWYDDGWSWTSEYGPWIFHLNDQSFFLVDTVFITRSERYFVDWHFLWVAFTITIIWSWHLDFLDISYDICNIIPVVKLYPSVLWAGSLFIWVIMTWICEWVWQQIDIW